MKNLENENEYGKGFCTGKFNFHLAIQCFVMK